MQKETLLTKLGMKDYNNELETILEQKNFTMEVKNLLLSMLYKIETSFEDFKTVKVEVEDKKNYIEELLTIIRVYCKKIEFVKPQSKEAEILETLGLHYIIESGTITTYQNEEYLLTALLKLKVTTKIEEECETLEQITNKAIHEMTVNANIIHNIQVIKDFDGWTWNISPLSKQQEIANIVYVNLVYLIGIDEILQAIFEREQYVSICMKKLTPYLGETEKETFMNLLIALCTENLMQENEGIYYKLETLKAKEEKEYIFLGNPETYFEHIRLEESKTAQKIAEIEQILKEDERLKKAYYAENEKLPEDKKFISISYYEDYLKNQKIQIRQKNLQYKHLLKPEVYETKRKTIKKKIEFYEWLQKGDTNEKMLELQKIFLKAFVEKIQKAETKKEIISYIYMLRYYNLLRWQETSIAEIGELQEPFMHAKKQCIKKALELKAIGRVCKEEEEAIEILLPIFQTKIIRLENVMLKIEQKDQQVELQLYDETTLEETIQLKIANTIKMKSKVKLLT